MWELKLPAEELISEQRAAMLIGRTSARLAELRYAGRGPASQKIGGRIRYRAADIQAWLNAEFVRRAA